MQIQEDNMEKRMNFSQIWKADAGVRLLASGMIADGVFLIITVLTTVAFML